jgi:hypothetical protein
MTTPNEKDAGSDRDAKPLGGEVAAPEDSAPPGGAAGPTDGIAGPSYPPAETEPDAH